MRSCVILMFQLSKKHRLSSERLPCHKLSVHHVLSHAAMVRRCHPGVWNLCQHSLCGGQSRRVPPPLHTHTQSFRSIQGPRFTLGCRIWMLWLTRLHEIFHLRCHVMLICHSPYQCLLYDLLQSSSGGLISSQQRVSHIQRSVLC